ncbi:hypothetical protein K438DRAFT_1778053 [Mycena galopus ATCC 62051]|nr:hypothetical protein K438DRAFT_1778053 [Mycena galopus ATCC 62051]
MDLGFDVAFSMHTTNLAPDMLPLMERLRLNQASCVRNVAKLQAYFFQTSNDDNVNVDTMYGQLITSVVPRDTVVGSMVAAVTGRRVSGYSTRAYRHQLSDFEEDEERLIGTDSESMPELVSEVGSVDLGLCPYYLGGTHTTHFECPLARSSTVPITV